MKKIIVALALLTIGASAHAQTIFEFNSSRFDVGFNVGQIGTFTDLVRWGLGGSVLINGIFVDFLAADPEHKYSNEVSDTKWNDTSAFCINAGYQFPILSWLRVMPLLGYVQTNRGVTDGSSMNLDTSDDSFTWYHDYDVTPGSRSHYFNYGGGISIQPCKWFSINAVFTARAIYGGIAIDALSIARYR